MRITITQAKIDAVKQYLQAEFPDFEVIAIGMDKNMLWKFRVLKNSATFCDIKFEYLFWNLSDFEDVKKTLEGYELSKVIKNNLTKTIIVTIKKLPMGPYVDYYIE